MSNANYYDCKVACRKHGKKISSIFLFSIHFHSQELIIIISITIIIIFVALYRTFISNLAVNFIACTIHGENYTFQNEKL